ncbi:MAG: protein kinase domain-containing protein [Tepidisphaeraceae bacterium]
MKGARPGRFTPQCPLCHERFVLTVPSDANEKPTAMPMPAKAAPGAPAPAAARSSGNPIEDDIAAALGIAQTPLPQPARMGAQVAPSSGAPPSRESASFTATTPPPGAPHAGDNGRTSHKPSSVAATAAPGPSDIGLAVADVDLDSVSASPATHASHAADASIAYTEARTAPAEEETVPARLGGYEIIQKLGQGGMGAVYLARQVSLDRNVAVKVLPTRMAEDPQFLARFTREAYAAAQLSHHNVVQIHDIGAERSTHFFSMEFVDGKNLADVVRKDGRLDPEAAAGYTLQAARGLKFAHDHGMVHRDIKPDNLLLNDQGIVKVADLGLVKCGAGDSPVSSSASGNGSGEKSHGQVAHAASNITQAQWAMGTPAYMAPEQASDAAAVDSRADIYALGCTLYDLLVGRPPFVGKTAVEVMTKHQQEQVVPPDRLIKHVPATLSSIVTRMMGKRPEDRYQSMGEVIKSLEGFLGVDSAGPFSPKAEHVKVLEYAAERFNGSKWRKLRPMIIVGFYAVCALGAIICGTVIADPVDKIRYSGAFVGMAVLTTIAYIITAGITQRTFVFKKMRQLVFGASFTDWVLYLAGFAVLCWTLYVFNQHVGWIIVAALAVLLASAFHFTVDLLMNKDRAQPVASAEALLREMRLKGLEENALRQFVCKYSGERWEEFYETLFGYEAKIQAREQWGKGDRGKDRKKFGAWRDVFIAWVDHKQKVRKERKAQKLLAKLEEKRLKSEGVGDKEAKAKAERVTDTMMTRAAKLQESARRAAATVGPAPMTMMKSDMKVVTPGWITAMHDDDHEESQTAKELKKKKSAFARRYGSPVDILFGQKMRFVLAVLVMLPFLSWVYQNKEGLANEARAISAQSRDPVDIANEKRIETAKQQVKDVALADESAKKLSTDALTDKMQKEGKVGRDAAKEIKEKEALIAKVFGNSNAGLAGAILLFGAFFRGRMLGLMVMVSAAVAIAGVIYAAQPLPMGLSARMVAMIAAPSLAALSIFFLRDTTPAS